MLVASTVLAVEVAPTTGPEGVVATLAEQVLVLDKLAELKLVLYMHVELELLLDILVELELVLDIHVGLELVLATLAELEQVPAIPAELELVIYTAELVLTEDLLAVLLELELALVSIEEGELDSVRYVELGVGLVER